MFHRTVRRLSTVFYSPRINIQREDTIITFYVAPSTWRPPDRGSGERALKKAGHFVLSLYRKGITSETPAGVSFGLNASELVQFTSLPYKDDKLIFQKSGEFVKNAQGVPKTKCLIVSKVKDKYVLNLTVRDITSETYLLPAEMKTLELLTPSILERLFGFKVNKNEVEQVF